MLVVIDKWYPSSKTCSDCGYVYTDLDLGQDEWVCPICGKHHDRDANAAINIREEGKRIFLAYFREQLAEKAKTDARAKARSDKRKASRKKASSDNGEAA